MMGLSDGRARLGTCLALLLWLLCPQASLAQGDEAKEDRYFTYQLSYVESERALALLATLGYPIIDLAGGTKFPRPEPDDASQGAVPIVYRLPDSEDISLEGSSDFGKDLFKSTTGVPQQRLLIAWRDSVELQKLLNLLNDHLDVAAKQILIDVLVIELDRDRFKDLGFSYEASKDGAEASFVEAEGIGLPFLYEFNRPSAKTIFEFKATVEALVESGDADVLSRPSVLVLDGRQARIDVEDQFPYSRVVRPKPGKADKGAELTQAEVISTSAYYGVGVVLNLRVRASEDNSGVTMRVETRINSRGSGKQQTTDSGGLIAPPLIKREVDTHVRVANDTPFIIGGLIKSTRNVTRSGIPVLSKIPVLGALFRRTNQSSTRKEVIIVLTPHIIPADDKSFSFTIAKDSQLFDRTDLTLFRNVYRVRRDDLFDLDFIEESEFMKSLSRWVLVWAERAYKSLVEELDFTPVPKGDRVALARRLREIQEQDPEVLRVLQESLVMRSLKQVAPGGPESVDALEEEKDPRKRRQAMRAMVEGLVSAQPSATEDDKQRLRRLEALLQAVTELSSSRPAEAFLQLLEGGIPGEDKFVKRMLVQMIEKRKFSRFVKAEKILFYELPSGSLQTISRPILDTERLYPRVRELDTNKNECQTLILSYPPQATSQGLSLDPPSARVSQENLPTREEFLRRLRRLNQPGPPGHSWASLAILLNDVTDCFESRDRSLLEHLKSVLVLKRLLELNPGLPLTLDGLHVGRDLVFPTEADLEARHHVVDREAATLFYETLDYYFAFERTIRQVLGTPGIETIVREGMAADARASG